MVTEKLFKANSIGVDIERTVLMKTRDLGSLISRMFLSAIFISGGVNKLMQREPTTQYMKAYHVPLIPLSLPLAALTEISAGTAMLVGLKGRLSASILFLYLVPTTFFFHRFWEHKEQERQMQLSHFFKNLAIMGGLLHVAAQGTGPLSVTRPENDNMQELTKLLKQTSAKFTRKAA